MSNCYVLNCEPYLKFHSFDEAYRFFSLHFKSYFGTYDAFRILHKVDGFIVDYVELNVSVIIQQEDTIFLSDEPLQTSAKVQKKRHHNKW